MLEETPFLVNRTDLATTLRCEYCLQQLNHDLKTDAQFLLNRRHQQTSFNMSNLWSTSTITCKCSSGGVCKALYCNSTCREAHASLHELLCPASSCLEARDFVTRSLQHYPYYFTAASLYLRVMISPNLCSNKDVMRWIRDKYPVVGATNNNHDGDCTNLATAAINDDDDDDDVMELFLLFVSSMSQNFSNVSSGEISARLSKDDWSYLYEVVLRYGHILSVSNPIIEFLKHQSGRLNSDDRTFFRRQPEIIRLYRLLEGSHLKISSVPNEQLSEREFCVLIHAACSSITPFDSNHITYLVMPQPDKEIVAIPFSCMPSASIDLVVNKNTHPLLVVQKRQTETSYLSLPRSINTSLTRQSNDVHASFILDSEVSETACIHVSEFDERLLRETKRFLDNYNTDNCSCTLCNFVCKFCSHVKVIPSFWDSLSDVSYTDCIQVGGYFLSHDTLGKKSMAAVMFHAAYTELMKVHESSSVKRDMGNYLHSIATLLLDVVTFTESQNSTFIPPSPVTIRNHWRSACKMWLRCQEIYPEHGIAKGQISKLLAYGNDYDFMVRSEDFMCRIEDVPNTIPFEKMSIDKEIHIFRTRAPVLKHSECKWIINEAEKHALTSTWTNNRHYSVPTTDIPLHEIPSVLQWFQNSFQSKLRSLLHDQFFEEFDGDVNSFYINDLFIVKYDATLNNENVNNCTSLRESKTNIWHWSSKDIEVNEMCVTTHQRFLPLHYDQSTHSIVIALNSALDFSGGGTYFDDLNEAISLDEGHMLSFCGNKLLHGGEPITSGTRYIMTMFMFLGATEEYIKKRKLAHPIMSSSEFHGDRHQSDMKEKRTKKNESKRVSFPNEINTYREDISVANKCENGDLNSKSNFSFNFF